MAVPLLDLMRQYEPLREEIRQAIDRVCESQRFILGAEVDDFERESAVVLETLHAVGVTSGTDALLVALMALGVGHGDEVVLPTFTFFATRRGGVTPRRDSSLCRCRSRGLLHGPRTPCRQHQ